MVRPIISVIGIGDLDRSDPLYSLAQEIGKGIIDQGYRLMTGGLGGVMEAASRGAHLSKNYQEGDVIGILPGLERGGANEFVDIPIPTGSGIGRNMIVTNSDAIIAVGGGSGTLSEIAFAWQKGKLIIGLKVDGWSGTVAGTRLDGRNRNPHIPDDLIFKASNAAEAMNILTERLQQYLSR